MSRVLLLSLVILLAPSGTTATHPRAVTLWAWERSEDLRFLPAGVDVAYLASTVTLHGGVSVRPRAQPLRVAPHTVVRPLVRIEAREGSSLSALSEEHEAALVRALLAAARGGGWLQVDFDARESERAAYVALLERLRREAPGLELSITGLASWCTPGSFIERAPVGSVVPQLFRMGAGADVFRQRAARFPARCARAVGLSVDEVLMPPPNARHLYLFNPRPWTADSFADAMTKVQQ